MSSGGARKRVCVSVGRCDPVIRCPLLPDAVLRTHGCSCFYTLCRTKIVMSKLSRSACIDTSPVGGLQAQDDAHPSATSGAEDNQRLRGYAPRRRATDRVCRHDHPAEGVEREGTAGMEKADVSALHAAVGQDMLRNLRIHAMTSKGVVRGRALPT